MSVEKKQMITLDKVIVKNLFGNLNYDINFKTDRSDLSILIAPNGCGKTTIFRLINFVFNPCALTYKNICDVPFESFSCVLSNGKIITLIHEKRWGNADDKNIDGDNQLGDEEIMDTLVHYAEELNSDRWSLTINEKTKRITIKPTYYKQEDELLPSIRKRSNFYINRAFRQFKDFLKENECAMAVFFLGTDRINHIDLPISFDSLTIDDNGPVMSTLKYVKISSASIMKRLRANFNMAMQKAQINLAWKFLDQTVVTPNFESFEKRWKEYRSEIENYAATLRFCHVKDIIKREHYENFEKIYNDKSDFLELYLNEFEKALRPIRNEFPKFKLLKDIFDERNMPTQKTLVYSDRNGIEIMQEGKIIPLEKLSSGEKNDMIMFYLLIFVYNRKKVLDNLDSEDDRISNDMQVAKNVASTGCLILIDEPELSLHIEWQESFLDYLITIQGMNQFQSIVATHSPNIINDHLDLIAEKR